MWNSVWAWLEGLENVRPSLEPALVGADSDAESRGSGHGGLPQLIGIGGEHLDDTGSTPLASRDLNGPHTRRDDSMTTISDLDAPRRSATRRTRDTEET